MVLRLETGREDDGRWIAELVDVPGALAYGESRREAIDKVATVPLRVIDERLAHGEELPPLDDPDSFASARHHDNHHT